MQKRLWISFFILIFFALPCCNQDESPTLIVDALNDTDKLPKNFRTTADLPSSINPTGLSDLHISGSGQFSERGFEALLKKLDVQKIKIVDLRQESHGFINGIAVSWYVSRDWINRGKTLAEIEKDEDTRLFKIQKMGQVLLFKIRKVHFQNEPSHIETTSAKRLMVTSTYTEKTLCQNHSIDYKRFPITDHTPPDDLIIDEWIQWISSLPEDTWVHIHCRAGQGRTTTLMALYDMMQNAKRVPLEEIIRRQQRLGGLDLFSLSPESHWKYPYEVQRKEMLERFYEYCKSNRDGFKTTWTAWNQSSPKKLQSCVLR